MKNQYTLLLLLISLVTFAQDISVEIKLKEKNKYINSGFATNGFGYFFAGIEKSKTDLNIHCFDSDLRETHIKNFSSNYKGLPAFFGRGVNSPNYFYDFYATPNGKYVILYDDNLIMDEYGNTKEFKHTKKFGFDDFNTKFYINSDDYACFFGHVKEGKKRIDSDEIYMYRQSFKDLSKNLIELKFPEFPSIFPEKKNNSNKQQKTKVSWELSRYTSDELYMINKELNKENTLDQYNIVSLDYDGNILKSLSIPVTLKNKYFTLSDNGMGSLSIVFYDNFSKSSFMNKSATGNIYLDPDKNHFYIYGLYSKNKLADLNKSYYNGLYVFKYNFNGDLIWSLEKEIVDKKGLNSGQRPLSVKLDLSIVNDNEVAVNIHSFYTKFAHFFILNSEDGKITKSKHLDLKIATSKLNAVRVSAFPTGYQLDSFKNKNFDIETIFASFINPKVEEFLKKETKVELNYNASISPQGVFIIEENPKEEKFKLLKFNH